MAAKFSSHVGTFPASAAAVNVRGALTFRELSDSVSDMKKITAREFGHGLGHLHETLKPGETLLVTKHGKPHLTVIKAGLPRRKAPNLLPRLQKHPRKSGQKIIYDILNENLR